MAGWRLAVVVAGLSGLAGTGAAQRPTVGLVLLIALIVPGGYGLGDVTLAIAIGVWRGLLSLPVIAAAVLYGRVLVVVSLLAGRLLHRRNPTGENAPDTPLKPALVAGAALALLLG